MRLTLIFTALWLIVVFVALPLLAFGLERTGAIFGTWGDWPQWWQRDIWVLAIGTALLYLSVLIGLALAAAFRRWLSTAAFAVVLALTIAAYSAIYNAHPERFRDVIDVISEPLTGSPAPTEPRPW
ncbi:MAG TPA: hypothetical protein VF062_16560 [Candidatus Limnocylindrales bacterium]